MGASVRAIWCGSTSAGHFVRKHQYWPFVWEHAIRAIRVGALVGTIRVGVLVGTIHVGVLVDTNRVGVLVGDIRV